jgi:23S rRNA (cytidine1920-2'-O)/16S rRNA (cytidine1409-2'-O)-methyltransferase
MRLDQYVSQYFSISRSKARDLILRGKITLDQEICLKAAEKVSGSEALELIEGEEIYVGRGAYKLIKALDFFAISPKDKICADFGASTGGFTEILLKNGASKCYAIDVGHDQLAPNLKTNPKVINMEGINIRYLEGLPEAIQLAVVDLSFISLRLVFEKIVQLIHPPHNAHSNCDLILLFKPQFEVGKAAIGKKGLVKSKELSDDALRDFCEWTKSLGLSPCGYTDSPIAGKEGNQEYLIHYHLE